MVRAAASGKIRRRVAMAGNPHRTSIFHADGTCSHAAMTGRHKWNTAEYSCRTMSGRDHIPPRVAETYLSGTLLRVNGKTAGIHRLGDIVAHVRWPRLQGERWICRAPAERAGQSGFVPEFFHDAYADSLPAHNPVAEKEKPRGGW